MLCPYCKTREAKKATCGDPACKEKHKKKRNKERNTALCHVFTKQNRPKDTQRATDEWDGDPNAANEIYIC